MAKNGILGLFLCLVGAGALGLGYLKYSSIEEDLELAKKKKAEEREHKAIARALHRGSTFNPEAVNEDARAAIKGGEATAAKLSARSNESRSRTCFLVGALFSLAGILFLGKSLARTGADPS